MKRLLILTLALAVLVAVAAPVGAAQGGKHGKPSAISLSIEADLWWANVSGDQITYTIGVDNRTGTALSGVTVRFIDNGDASSTLLDDNSLANGINWFEEVYLVDEDDVASAEGSVADLPPIVGTVTVTFGDRTESATDMVDAKPLPRCPFSGDEGGLSMSDWVGGPCYYPFAPDGYWTIVAMVAPGRHHPHDLVFTMRDHYPGNWCMADAPDGSDDRFTMYVFFPEKGICLQGGMGGDEMPVGNPDNFVLVAPPGTVTATHEGN